MYHGKKHGNRFSDMMASRSICFFLRKSGSANRKKICLLRAMVATPAMVLHPKVLAACGKQWCENLKQKTPEVNRSSLQALHFSKCMAKLCVTSVHPASMQITQLPKCGYYPPISLSSIGPLHSLGDQLWISGKLLLLAEKNPWRCKNTRPIEGYCDWHLDNVLEIAPKLSASLMNCQIPNQRENVGGPP